MQFVDPPVGGVVSIYDKSSGMIYIMESADSESPKASIRYYTCIILTKHQGS